MYKIIAGIIALVIIVGGVVIAVGHKSKKNDNQNAPTTSQTSTTSQAPATAQSTTKKSANVITYDGSTFSPSTLTVKSGDSVTVKNSSSQTVQLQSNPHPTHTDDPDLNVGTIEAGKSATFTVTQTGTFGYHNHLDPAQGGTITIQ